MSYLVISLDIGSIIRNRICNAKVNQFEFAFHEDEIGGFEVGVDNFLLVDDMHGL